MIYVQVLITMIIILNNQQNNNWWPDVKRILNSDFQIPLYHATHEHRHPQAIYNISYSTVIESFNATVKTLFEVMNERSFLEANNPKWYKILVAKQKDLLYALMEYLDDCENILACFFPPNEKRSDNTNVKLYLRYIKEYRDHIGKIVNHIKHEQGRLRPIVFFKDKLILPGYFIENVNREGEAGPVEKIHPGGNTAFSFARDLRYNFFYFHAVAKHLGDTIINIVGSRYTPNPQENLTTDRKVLEVASAISGLPLFFYPDEISKPVPSVIINQNSDGQSTITLMYPNNVVRVPKLPSKMKVMVGFQGDGVTRSFRFPYPKNKSSDD